MKRVFMLCIGMLACASAFAADQPQRLTLTQALDLMHANNPTLRAAQAHQSAVQAVEVTAALRINPTVTSANEDFNVFEPSKLDPANNQEFTNSLAWTFERGGKRRERVASAKAATTVGRDTVADLQRQLDFQLKSTFVNTVLAKALLNLANDNLSEYQQTVEANRVRFEAGDISETEFDRIALESSRFQSDVLNAEASLAQAKAQLASLIGRRDSSQLDVDGTLDVPTFAPSIEEAESSALSHRPDLIAARDTVLKSEADLRLARANGATDIVVAPEYKRNGPDNTLGFTVQFPLRVFDRNQGEKLRTTSELESSRFAQTAAELQVHSDVRQAWAAYVAAEKRTVLYSSDYLKRARNVRDRMTFSYEHGATSLLDYLDALRSYRDVEVAALTANAQTLIAIHQLSFVTATEMMP